MTSTTVGAPAADRWHSAIIEALGTNPRRLKRVANTLRVMHALATRDSHPLSDQDSSLLLKLGLIAYRNSAILNAMRRDPKLGEVLQEYAHASAPAKPDSAKKQALESLPTEFRALAGDHGLWELFRRSPDLTGNLIKKGSAWLQAN